MDLLFIPFIFWLVETCLIHENIKHNISFFRFHSYRFTFKKKSSTMGTCCSSNKHSKKLNTESKTTILSMDLSRNNLVEIPMDVFEPSLEFLDLSYNKLHDLNPVLIRCTQLKVLNLSDNHLEDIPDALKSLKELTELNLSHNKLQYIPLVINQFAQLTKLDLSNNSIEKIYGTITEMITLRELRLNDCSICFLPANLGRLVNLEVLEVRGNGLEGLPPTFKLLTKLTLLDIGRNYFRVLVRYPCKYPLYFDS